MKNDIYTKLIQNQKLLNKLQDKLAYNNQILLNKLSKKSTKLEHDLRNQIEIILFDFDIKSFIQQRNFINKHYIDILKTNNLLLTRNKKLILVNELFTNIKVLKMIKKENDLLIENQNFVIKNLEAITQNYKLVLEYCCYGIINNYPNSQKHSDELIKSSREKVVISSQLVILSKLSISMRDSEVS